MLLFIWAVDEVNRKQIKDFSLENEEMMTTDPRGKFETKRREARPKVCAKEE